MMYFEAAAAEAAYSTMAEAQPLPTARPGHTLELSVLTYNVRGLPWPAALGRGAALKAIGRELAQMRAEGRQPDVVLIQEGFRAEITDLVRESGYRYWAQGPARGAGALTGSGLHVLSDAPIVGVVAAAYADCAGLDCLASKGVMMVRIAPPGAPGTIDIVNTHMNARHASRAPPQEALAAHQRQTDQLIAFVNAHRDAGAPMLVGGDFNVRHAPQRYYHDALERPYTVVAEYCAQPQARCDAADTEASDEPWLASQDLQAFSSDASVLVRPIAVETLFGAPDPRARLSDHDGYLVRYRISWAQRTFTAVGTWGPFAVKPRIGKWGVKISWTP